MASLAIWGWSIGSVLFVSLVSLVGVVFLKVSKSKLEGILFMLVSFAAGAMLGDAAIHILPEAVRSAGFTLSISLSFLSGILIFFVLEKFIHWRHCHIPTSESHPHPFAYMNLVGDSVHNLIDGLIIAGSFIVSIPVGIGTTIAVLFHEIPQEIGDYGVLIHGGFSRKKAILFNFLTALTAVLGSIISLLVASRIDGYLNLILPFTAGGFIYIAGSDLIPELNKESAPRKSALQLLGIILGIAVMLVLVLFG
jgi:zinc and cadmium transporter